MSINNMKNRLNYRGGANQIARMNADKLKALESALLYSYQSATIRLLDGREFKCLINPDRLNMDLDNKILSIPFKSINQNGREEEVGIKEGDVIEWKENGTKWIVYLQRLEETAYFRADLRRCHYALTLDNGSQYWAYVRGPVEQIALWTQTAGNYINKLNYTLTVYLTKNEETLQYFQRFKKVEIDNKPWEVQVVDSISTPGILEVILKETYSNTIETNVEQAVINSQKQKVYPTQLGTYIYGADLLYPYDTNCKYEIKEATNGFWKIIAQKNIQIEVLSNTANEIVFNILSGKSGEFELEYIVEDAVAASKKIKIGSLM